MAGFDPISLGLTALGFGSTLLGKDKKKVIGPTPEQKADRSRFFDLTRPVEASLRADLTGQGSIPLQLAQSRATAITEGSTGAADKARQQALIDLFARTGGVKGRSEADLTAPTASAALAALKQQQGMASSQRMVSRELTQAQQAEQRRQEAISGLGRLALATPPQLPREQTITEPSPLFDIGSSLLGIGIGDILEQRRKNRLSGSYSSTGGAGSVGGYGGGGVSGGVNF